MILPDFKIRQWAASGGMDPFNPNHVNPASVDLTLGQSYIDLATEEEHALTGPICLAPGEAILATTAEFIRLPSIYAATVYLKSSMARLGLDHALAGWVDPGFEGTLTLELHSHRTIELRPCQRVIQLVLSVMESRPQTGYDGRYQGQRGPTMARIQPVTAKSLKVGPF
jgi:dCTP deaminase